MGNPTFTQWMQNTPYAVGSPGSVENVPPPIPWFRSVLDKRLSGWDSTPEASYPDGYLGTITDRQQGKKYGARNNLRPQSRGIHKGEAVNPQDYSWPDDYQFNGVRAVAAGVRQVPLSEFGGQPYVGAHLVNSGKWMPRGSEGLITIDPTVRAKLAAQAPPWR